MKETGNPFQGDASGDNAEWRFPGREKRMAAMKAGEKWQKGEVDTELNAAIRNKNLERFKKFLRFELLPESDSNPGFFIVTGTSPIIDKERYDDQIAKAVELTENYPDSKIIFSGKMPADARKTGEETISEAEMMAQAARDEGVAPEQIITETQSRHLKENIEFSLAEIIRQLDPAGDSAEVAVVASMSMMRRCYYYALNIMESDQFSPYKDKLKFYFIPSGDNLDDEEAVYYEMRRLLEYREKEWL